MNNVQESPRVKKESKNKIKVEFERTPLKDRLKAKFINGAFITNVIWYIFPSRPSCGYFLYSSLPLLLDDSRFVYGSRGLC